MDPYSKVIQNDRFRRFTPPPATCLLTPKQGGWGWGGVGWGGVEEPRRTPKPQNPLWKYLIK